MFTTFYRRQNHEWNLAILFHLLFGTAHQTNFGGLVICIVPNKTVATQYLLF